MPSCGSRWSGSRPDPTPPHVAAGGPGGDAGRASPRLPHRGDQGEQQQERHQGGDGPDVVENSSQRRRIAAWSGGAPETAHTLIRPLIGTLPRRVTKNETATSADAAAATRRAAPCTSTASASELRNASAIVDWMTGPFIRISALWKVSRTSSGTALKVWTTLTAP